MHKGPESISYIGTVSPETSDALRIVGRELGNVAIQFIPIEHVDEIDQLAAQIAEYKDQKNIQNSFSEHQNRTLDDYLDIVKSQVADKNYSVVRITAPDIGTLSEIWSRTGAYRS